MFYDNLKAACARKKVSVTKMLIDIGRPTSLTGSWGKQGSSPSLSVLIEISNYLHVSIDELAFGREEHIKRVAEDEKPLAEQMEWIDLISLIPENKKQMCMDFIRTHIVTPKRAYKAG